MAYDLQLADRVQYLLGDRPDLTVRKMFGGIAFQLGDHMACGVLGGELIVRCPKEGTEGLLEAPGTRPFDFTGKAIRGFVMVEVDSLDDEALAAWVLRGMEYAESLPPKK
ncbi:TfoX/Sxy family protein [Sulfuriroseicoccus oceanibius]|uniref:TfoX/Sxy family protein n=1 Tax=Sulfuriroseicoccus oceanibius TaxID=2707525 RepID=A0A6B3L6F4_9BACT|nr:TfoX/Sxy family protein [Sulfuriroseicoccus oceanibius]QQL45378.1 TfoX/Sxy family protein [Sulfuriroseicoccus oceanibius]